MNTICKIPSILPHATGASLHWVLLVILFLTYPQSLCASYYKSAEDLQPVTNPEQHIHKAFIWRTGANPNYQFVQVQLNDLLYRNKKAYAWPEHFTTDQKPQIIVFSTNPNAQSSTNITTDSVSSKPPAKPANSPSAHNIPYEDIEILFNDLLILSDEKQLFYWHNNQYTPLQKIKAPGLFLVNSNQNATITNVIPISHKSSSNTANKLSLPRFIQSHPDSLYILESPGHIPVTMSFVGKEATFQPIVAELTPLPIISLSPFSVNLDSVQTLLPDNQKVPAIDSILHALQIKYRNDSIAVHIYHTNLRQLVTNHNALLPNDQIAKLANESIAQANALSNISSSLKNTQDTRTLLVSYKTKLEEAQVAKSFFGRGNAAQSLVQSRFNNRFFISGHTLGGRNMPKTLSNPGPDNLYGFGGGIHWTINPYKSLILEPRLLYTDIRWHFNQDVIQLSAQQRISYSFIFQLPLFISPYITNSGTIAGSGLLLGVGPAGDYVFSKTHNNQYQEESFLTWGGHIQARLFFTPLPICLTILYTLHNTTTGELLVSLALPIPFLPTKRGSQ